LRFTPQRISSPIAHAKPKRINCYCFFFIAIDIAIDIAIFIAIVLLLPLLLLFYSLPVTLSFTEGWVEDKKNPVSLETGFSKTRGVSRTGEAKATFDPSKANWRSILRGGSPVGFRYKK
jgi:hypothetical protein